jgi:leader peptidase (prepilin peptidase)/N-methyltransferase
MASVCRVAFRAARRKVLPVAGLLVLIALLGLAVGSFLTVVIDRVPRGESVVRPGSRCSSCGRQVRARYNIPVLGWILLRGRCADCHAPIGVRYPLVELATAALFVAVTARLSGLGLLSALPAYLWFTAAGIALAVIDLDTRRLPNAIVLPSYPVLAVLVAGSALYQGDWSALGRAAIGAAGLFGFYLLLVLAYPKGMGWGDVKLAGLLGGALGYLSWAALIVGAFAGFVLGALVGVAVILARQGDRKTALPFGPFMVAGALLAIFVADPIARAYLSLAGSS